MHFFSYHDILFTHNHQVAETGKEAPVLTERHIQAIWLEQKYFQKLYTSSGEELTVISPGIWNTESGPDFMKAHLKIGSETWLGDIEIHLHEESWYHHHHHLDERYNHVVLHLAFWQPKKSKQINKKNGEQTHQAYLEHALSVPIDQLISLIDLDLYPYKKSTGSGRCASLLFQSLSDVKVKAFFSSAAYWRLEQKKRYLSAHFLTPSLQLVGGMAIALGYKNNAQPFLDLFQTLWENRDLPESVILAIGLGCCGFFEDSTKNEWKSSSYYCELRHLWWGEKARVNHQTKLKLDHIRPLNHPIRRLAYLAKLLADSKSEQLWEKMLMAWHQFAKQKNDQPKALTALKHVLFDSIPSYEDKYWNAHYLFEKNESKKSVPLIGENLKTEILLNVFLPMLYAEIKEQGEAFQITAFKAFFNHFKAIDTRKNRYLMQRFFGDSSKTTILNKAQMEQGAYQLHKDFCAHFEASCEGCPFVERYNRFN